MANLIKAELLPFFRTYGVQQLGVFLEGTILGPSELQEGDAKPRGGALRVFDWLGLLGENHHRWCTDR